MPINQERSSSVLDRVLGSHGWIILAALATVVLSGLYLTTLTGNSLMMSDMMGSGGVGLAARAGLLFVMWCSMMVAMMLPSAAPAILTYRTVSRNFAQKGARVAPLWLFIMSYLVMWTAFSALMVVLQLTASNYIELTGMYAVASRVVGGVILIAAGVYQFTPLKQSCLTLCQTPLHYFASRWQAGWRGGAIIGMRYGLYCLGCCWLLMGLLFYGGVMELNWIIGLAVYVAIEKFVPARYNIHLLVGAIMVLIGAWQVVAAWNA